MQQTLLKSFAAKVLARNSRVRQPCDNAGKEVLRSVLQRRIACDTDATGNAPVASERSWPPVSLDAERRFGQPHAKLFLYLSRKVHTPAGPGTLLQVFAERVTVLLDSELSRCSFFAPGQVEPVSWDSTDG